MFNRHKQSDRFANVINELNRSCEFKAKGKHLLKPASEISLLGKSGTDFSDHSTKDTHSPLSSNKRWEMSEEMAIELLLESYEVMVNHSRTSAKVEFVPTSKGLKYVLVFNDLTYVNLSWVHSAQELERNKILILYYSMQRMKVKQKPGLESLVIEFGHQQHLANFLSAVLYIHENYHDEEVERVYHQLCST
jgi:hypothetical protein